MELCFAFTYAVRFYYYKSLPSKCISSTLVLAIFEVWADALSRHNNVCFSKSCFRLYFAVLRKIVLFPSMQLQPLKSLFGLCFSYTSFVADSMFFLQFWNEATKLTRWFKLLPQVLSKVNINQYMTKAFFDLPNYLIVQKIFAVNIRVPLTATKDFNKVV